ncbi:hypothetical protein ACLOJK_007676 [Asimina triloba]
MPNKPNHVTTLRCTHAWAWQWHIAKCLSEQQLFLQMEAERVDPDAVTLASILPTCGDLPRIHEYISRKRMGPNFSWKMHWLTCMPNVGGSMLQGKSLMGCKRRMSCLGL